MNRTLVDTSVWIRHLKGGDERLAELLEQDDAMLHPFVIGELALGGLGPSRAAILSDLHALPVVSTLRDSEVHLLVEAHGLAGSGIGWVDAHILAAARVNGLMLHTYDQKLSNVAQRLL